MENAGKKEAVCIGRAARALPRCRVLVSEIQPSDRSTMTIFQTKVHCENLQKDF